MRRYIFLLAAGVLAGLVAVLAIVFTQPYTFKGMLISPPQPAVDFTLRSTQGGSFELSQQKGKIVLLFFGYTTCPDVCPTTLSQFRQINNQLGDQAAKVDFVFITVDPQRDTVDRLSSYLDQFDPRFVGLSGSETELDPVWKAYGVYRQVQPIAGTSDYFMDHSAQVYLIDAQGKLHATYAFGSPAEDLLSDIRYLLKG